MSVPLDAIPTYDTDERIKRVEQWQEYHRAAREELNRVLARQQVPASPSSGTLPATPKTRLRSASNGWTGTPAASHANRAGIKQVFTPPASPLRAPDEAAASEVGGSTPTKDTKTPTLGKVSTRIRGMFTPKKKAHTSHNTTDDYSDIQRTMGVERLEPAPASERPRTADPKDGGQGPGEDSWGWYTRNMYANKPLPPLPPLPPVGPMPGVRNGVGAVAR